MSRLTTTKEIKKKHSTEIIVCSDKYNNDEIYQKQINEQLLSTFKGIGNAYLNK